jgi:isoleucyl-tRNA synthetase
MHDHTSLEPQTPSLIKEMELVRRVVGLGRVARKTAGLRVRQPLARMLVAVGTAEERLALERLQDELLDELNVKALHVLDNATELVRYRIRPNLRLLGPRLGKALPALRAAVEELAPQRAAAVARAVAAGEPVTLALAAGQIALAPEELLVETAPLAGYAVAQEGGLQVALDTTLTGELRREGLARDLVRAIQEARKSARLAIADRVAVQLAGVAGDEELEAVVHRWGAYIRAETLADDLVLAAPAHGVHSETLDLDGRAVTLSVTRR